MYLFHYHDPIIRLVKISAENMFDYIFYSKKGVFVLNTEVHISTEHLATTKILNNLKNMILKDI